jgi:hypothetical protein
MGLDTVELVIRFEDTFGITISDEVAAELTTPRKVADYIMTQVAVSNQPACLSQQAFYFLREKFLLHLHLSRSYFRPKVPLENLIPKEDRKFIWAELRSEIGAKALPDLARPLWLFYSLAFLTVLTSVYAAVYAWNNFNFGAVRVIGFSFLVAIGTAYSSMILTRPFKVNFRRAYSHAGDLADYLITHSPHTFKKQNRGWTREQVAAVVRELIIDETGVTDFTEDSHFIDDMHLG